MYRKFMTFSETMEFLRLSRPTVSRLIARGEIPSYKIGKLRIFDQEELIDWVKSHRDDKLKKSSRKKGGKRL